MARRRAGSVPRKIGMSRSGQAGPRLDVSREREPLEGKEKDVQRASRAGQSGKKGRPLPSREVAVKDREGKSRTRAGKSSRRTK